VTLANSILKIYVAESICVPHSLSLHNSDLVLSAKAIRQRLAGISQWIKALKFI